MMGKTVSKTLIISSLALLLLLTAFILPCAPAQAADSDPQCWGVFVGVSDYEFINDLYYGDDDAVDFYNTFAPVWGTSNTRLLVDSQAAESDILDAISWLAENADVNDTVVFTYSGHGSESGALCPYDITFDGSGISPRELSEALDQIQAEKIVVILDMCYAGKAQIRLSKDGRVLMLASQSDEFSQEDPHLRNGVFSYFILEALDEFDMLDINQDYELSVEEIAEYANQMTADYESDQNPILDDEYFGELALLAKFLFALNISLPTGTVILTIDGVDYTSPPPGQLWSPGSTHLITVPEAVYVGSGTRYAFTGWNDGDTLATRIISKGFLSADYNLEQLFDIITPFGTATGAGWYSDGAMAGFSITNYIETPDTRHIFSGWSGDFSGTSTTGTIYVDAPKTITANWRTEYLLKLNSEYGIPAGTGWYNEGETVSISIEPAQGFLVRQIFDGWTGDFTSTQSNVTLTMNSPRVISAMWHTDYMQLYVLFIVIIVVAGIVISIILVRRKSARPPVPPATLPPTPPASY